MTSLSLLGSLRLSYLPPLMVYMAAGIQGLTGIVGTFFIKEYLDLSAEFLKVFTDELQNKGGYQVVTSGAEDVLVLRPAIMDLDVTAPDTMSAGRSYTLTESAGAMTLYLEVYDSVTSQILARAIDRETSRGMGRIQWANSVTNKQEADRVLRRWASALRSQLDAVHGK